MKPLRLDVMLVPMERPLALTSYNYAAAQPEPTQDNLINHTVPAVRGKVKAEISLPQGAVKSLQLVGRATGRGSRAQNRGFKGGIYPQTEKGGSLWPKTVPTAAAPVLVPAQRRSPSPTRLPKPSAMLSATQKDGKTLVAAEVYEKTWTWLAERGCAALVSPQLLERYAMSVARWIQCEEAITEYGFLAKHPTTGNAIQSPYVAMSQNFMSQTNRLWMEIYQIVKENCSSEYGGATPQDDVMERLLSARKGN